MQYASSSSCLSRPLWYNEWVTVEENQNQSFIHRLSSQEKSPFFGRTAIIGAVIIILSGIATGYILSRSHAFKKSLPREGANPSDLKRGQAFGSEDTKTFRDTAEGTLEKGGVGQEGSHKLIRPGGDSQTAALTSSIVNLDQFIGRKIKVWGETQKASKAGWLMDVGRLEVQE